MNFVILGLAFILELVWVVHMAYDVFMIVFMDISIYLSVFLLYALSNVASL